MKHRIASLLALALALTLVLCACGSMDHRNAAASPAPTTTATPGPGEVTDRDGFIGDGDDRIDPDAGDNGRDSAGSGMDQTDIGSAVDRAGEAVGDVARDVGNAAGDVAEGTGNAVRDALDGEDAKQNGIDANGDDDDHGAGTAGTDSTNNR